MRDDRQGDRPPKRMSDQPGQTDPDVAVEELGPSRPWGRVVMLAGALNVRPVPLGGGTISRHIICSGQLFAQFFRSHPEELPEAQRGQLQAQEAVRRLMLSVPGPELM